ncbi:MAG: FAD-dependent oxidoreductase, partial [Pseudomonadota bacterium]
AARELYRCGFDVSIFEASDRIGGRLYTRDNPNNNAFPAMEMGAMRMPFFIESGSVQNPEQQNSLLGYYLNSETRSILADFPNPGQAPDGTGVYINRGLGPENNFPKPELIPWPKGGQPENPQLQIVSKAAAAFQENFVAVVQPLYVSATDQWEAVWGKMTAFYDNYTFGDIVTMPAKSLPEMQAAVQDPNFDGDLGGFGMTEEQSSLLYTIGTGDGSWGAFYDISALWFMRCTFFGFDSHLQTVEGLADTQQLPSYGAPAVDANGFPIPAPYFQGIQSLVEYLYFVAAPGAAKSLHEAGTLRLNTKVFAMNKRSDGKIDVYRVTGAKTYVEIYDYVIVTASQWASQLSMAAQGFPESELPQAKITAQHTQHNISSCKLFFPLTQPYWKPGVSSVPQIIVTDTYIQDVYGLEWGSRDGAILLASYTWEDDANKLLPFDEAALTETVLGKLREITLETTGEDITRFVDASKPVMIQWIQQPTYIGCAKLYRSGNQAENMLDLGYNQNYAGASHLYFAGENYGVEGGWTEPALRSALDAVMQLLNHSGARFSSPDFNFDQDYPRWPS